MVKSLKHTKATRLLWVDLEMTGLDPIKDRILEIAAIVTDWDLKELATYEAVVKVGPSLMKKRMVGDFWEANTTARDGLIAQNEKGKNLSLIHI